VSLTLLVYTESYLHLKSCTHVIKQVWILTIILSFMKCIAFPLHMFAQLGYQMLLIWDNRQYVTPTMHLNSIWNKTLTMDSARRYLVFYHFIAFWAFIHLSIHILYRHILGESEKLSAHMYSDFAAHYHHFCLFMTADIITVHMAVRISFGLMILEMYTSCSLICFVSLTNMNWLCPGSIFLHKSIIYHF